MQYTSILLRPGELFLKGKNRLSFEQKLINNYHLITQQKEIKRLQGRFIIPYFNNHSSLKKLFGLTSYSPAIRVEKSLDKIKKVLLDLAEGKNGTFKIEPKRSDKRFPLTSPELNIILGKYIEQNTNLLFNGQAPNHLFGIEINQDGAYLFSEIIPCYGGLPTGIEGKVLLLLENEASVLAGLLIMKRGCALHPVCLNIKKDNINRDTSLLQQYSPQSLHIISLSNLKEIEQFAKEHNFNILVSGQHFENFEKYNTSLTILRPLISFKVEEIITTLNYFSNI